MCQLIPWHHQQRNTKGYIADFHCILSTNVIIFIKGKVKFLLAKDNQGMQQVCKLMWVEAGAYRHGHGLRFSNPSPTHTHDAGIYTKYDTVILRSLTHAHTKKVVTLTPKGSQSCSPQIILTHIDCSFTVGLTVDISILDILTCIPYLSFVSVDKFAWEYVMRDHQPQYTNSI